MRIFAFHLLNDYSGSPKVLMQLLKGWIEDDFDVTVVTCNGREGFLSNIKGVKYKYYWYRWAKNPLLRLLNLTLSQFILLIKMLFEVKKNDIVYINTVLPFGAAFLGKIIGCRVIYHIHETTIKPASLKKFLFGMVSWTADDVIYVSKYLSEQENIPNKKIHVLYNAIENSFYQTAINNRKKGESENNILMVCSLKKYKGVSEYNQLALLNPNFNFKLVVNASQNEIDAYFAKEIISKNLVVYPTQTNLHPFYSEADIVLNLSRPDGWVETFGLTIIEAMAYGLPVIVPPIGGIIELVDNEKNGFYVDCREMNSLSSKLQLILCDKAIYKQMNSYSNKKIMLFKEDFFKTKSIQIINNNRLFEK